MRRLLICIAGLQMGMDVIPSLPGPSNILCEFKVPPEAFE